MDASSGGSGTTALTVVIAVVGLAVVLLLLPEPAFAARTLVANLLALVTSAMAAGCAVWRAVRSTGRRRRAWAVLAGGIACWVVGQGIWTWLQAAGEDPFPSLADVAYLGFGPLVCVGLLLLPTGGVRDRRLQGVLDGVAVSLALLLISWQTALGAAVGSADEVRVAATVVSVAYPVVDVAVLVITVLTLARTPAGSARPPLVLLAAGLVAISVADSAFVYLIATIGYQPGSAVDITWNVGFGCLAAAALLDRTDRRDRAQPADPGDPAAVDALPAGGLLPYVPVGLALAVAVATRLLGRIASPGEEVVALGLILLLLGRQYLTLRQNARLAADLHHQAFHDTLTGLANRALFRDRLGHALELHARDGRPVAVLFLDLDDFKAVNDTLGHTVGDHLLVGIAKRLAGVVRAADTVARLGGDEFAILVESGDDPHRVAARVAEALLEPVPVGDHELRARASVGVIRLAAGDPPIPTEDLMAQADIAMYATKRAGRTG